uniref:Structural maintenance of chromosomes protein 6 n=1 Tax=Ornithorhynchus anatinus TaxID=9258 RepID=A0A6I8NTN1_ORNAN
MNEQTSSSLLSLLLPAVGGWGGRNRKRGRMGGGASCAPTGEDPSRACAHTHSFPDQRGPTARMRTHALLPRPARTHRAHAHTPTPSPTSEDPPRACAHTHPLPFLAPTGEEPSRACARPTSLPPPPPALSPGAPPSSRSPFHRPARTHQAHAHTPTHPSLLPLLPPPTDRRGTRAHAHDSPLPPPATGEDPPRARAYTHPSLPDRRGPTARMRTHPLLPRPARTHRAHAHTLTPPSPTGEEPPRACAHTHPSSLPDRRGLSAHADDAPLPPPPPTGEEPPRACAHPPTSPSLRDRRGAIAHAHDAPLPPPATGEEPPRMRTTHPSLLPHRPARSHHAHARTHSPPPPSATGEEPSRMRTTHPSLRPRPARTHRAHAHTVTPPSPTGEEPPRACAHLPTPSPSATGEEPSRMRTTHPSLRPRPARSLRACARRTPPPLPQRRARSHRKLGVGGRGGLCRALPVRRTCRSHLAPHALPAAPLSKKGLMGKRKDEHFQEAGNHKRPRQESENESDTELDEDKYLRSLSSTASNSQATSGEVGIIESIQLKNFMCHSMLGPFKFGPNVNFVIGNNGSGKSAVLTALIVGLGGKAIATNRGSSLKGFVKDGENSADVLITLRNRGGDAYKPQVFGDSITVHQHITVEGNRSYKLKSKTGSLVSCKKEELIAILDHFNIQVDNPVSVLTQEMSKSFLQTKNEGDKYKFFMKATQLEQMRDDYSYIMEKKARTHDQIEQGGECLLELKRNCVEKEELFKSIVALSELKVKLENLKHEMAWAVVGEIEKQTKEMRSIIKEEESRNMRYNQKLLDCEARVNEAEEKYKKIQDDLEKITEGAVALEPEYTKLKADVRAKNQAYNTAELFYKCSLNEYSTLEKDGEQLMKRIEELKNSADQISEPEKLERQRKIFQLKEKSKILCNEEQSVGQDINQFKQAIIKYKEEQSKLKREELAVKQKMGLQQRQIKELKDSKNDQLKRFGAHIPSLLKAIEDAYKQGQFTQKPIGPLGACIHLRDPELALAIESCLKGLLLAFCCHNHRDEQTLQALMRKFCPPGSRPQIIVSEFRSEMYDVRPRAVYHPNHPTVLTALDMDNAVVANSLIDMRGIETILLIKNNSEARTIMQTQKPPKNCREAFTALGDQVFEKRYYSGEFSRPRFLSRDVETEISHLEKDVANKMAELLTFQQRMHSIENDIKQNEDHLRNFSQHLRDLKIKRCTVDAEIKDLENVEELQSVDISTLEEEAQENRTKMAQVKQNMQQRKCKMEDLKKQKMEAELKCEEIKRKIHLVSETAEPLKEDLSQADSEVDNQKRYRDHYNEKWKEHMASLKRKEEDLAAKEKELEVKISQAKQICSERKEVNRTARSIDMEIIRLREKINSESNRQGNREEILKQYRDAKNTYQDIEGKVKNLKRFIKLLDEIMTQRYKTYQQFRRCLTLRCKFYFDSLLAQRAYSGKMSFDHRKETLAISVQPGEGNKAILNDMRALSGGERSFSTVCFILSLWSITESPFRCLDEFDVYMDMVNRRISMDMMLKMADSQRFRQFILLTPQSMR